MKRFEYVVFSTYTLDPHTFTQDFNKLGKEGWELVTMVYVASDPNNGRTISTFRRELPLTKVSK